MQHFTESVESVSAREAYSWLAELAPLLEPVSIVDEEACRRRLDVVTRLRSTGPQILASLTAESSGDGVLGSTLEHALGLTGRLEEDLRTRIGQLAPGASEGRVDLDMLRDRIAVVSAQQEIASYGTAPLERMEWKTGIVGVVNPGSALATRFLVPALFYVAFFFALSGHLSDHARILVSCVLAFLCGMVVRAMASQSPGRMVLEGRHLSVWRRGKRRDIELGPQSRAYISSGGGTGLVVGRASRTSILVVDAHGRLFQIRVMPAPAFQEELVQAINSRVSHWQSL